MPGAAYSGSMPEFSAAARSRRRSRVGVGGACHEAAPQAARARHRFTDAHQAATEVPTVAEAGYPDYEVDQWFGLWAPAKTPKETVAQVAGWFTAATEVEEKTGGVIFTGFCICLKYRKSGGA